MGSASPGSESPRTPKATSTAQGPSLGVSRRGCGFRSRGRSRGMDGQGPSQMAEVP